MRSLMTTMDSVFLTKLFPLPLYFATNIFQHMVQIPSRGCLEVEAWTDNSLHSALVGSNPV